MKLLSLDPSLTRTGYAIFTAPPVRFNTLKTGSFASADAEDFVGKLLKLLTSTHVDFVAAEEARKVILMYGKKQLVGTGIAVTPNGNQLKLSEIQGALRGICAARRVPLSLVRPPTWRAAVLGNGHLSRPEAKAAAKEHCRRLGVAAANHDVAEAICIGLWAATCSAAFRLAALEQEGHLR